MIPFIQLRNSNDLRLLVGIYIRTLCTPAAGDIEEGSSAILNSNHIFMPQTIKTLAAHSYNGIPYSRANDRNTQYLMEFQKQISEGSYIIPFYKAYTEECVILKQLSKRRLSEYAF